jgi:hypothetical protein
MLRSVKKCKGYSLAARDERGHSSGFGHVREFYFDDANWTIRYLVAQAGNWLTGRLVLISPFALGKIDDEARTIAVHLTRDQIRNGPSPEADRPVSRQFEMDYSAHFGWPYYWVGPYLWGPSPYPVMPSEAAGVAAAFAQAEHKGDPHLRSTDEVVGYHIKARDGEIGHLEDFLFSDGDWALHYACVATRNWLPGKHVLAPPAWIKEIDWADSSVTTEASREDNRQAPAYDPSRGVDAELEHRLSDYYETELRKA